MSTEFLKKLARRGRHAPHGFWEIVIAATLLPPLVHAVATSLGASPAMAAAAAVQPAQPAAAPAAGLRAVGRAERRGPRRGYASLIFSSPNTCSILLNVQADADPATCKPMTSSLSFSKIEPLSPGDA